MLSLTTLRAAGMAAFLVGGFVGIAKAADMMAPPPPPVPMAPPPTYETSSGFYLRGDIGLSAHSYSALDLRPLPAGGATILGHSLSNSAILGIGAGYQVNSWLRGDITAEYRTSSRIRIVEWESGLGGGNTVRGKLTSGLFLANAYVDLGTWHRLTPFVGLGVGLAMINTSGITDRGFGAFAGGTGAAPSKTETKFAWAVHAGASYDLTSNLKVEGAYRYTHFGTTYSGGVVCTVPCATARVRMKGLDSHDFRVGVRYIFADAAPMMAPGPLIRKY